VHDRLAHVVLEDSEVLLSKVSNRAAISIDDTHVDRDRGDASAESGLRLLAGAATRSSDQVRAAEKGEESEEEHHTPWRQ
jgi:hypothetical protein